MRTHHLALPLALFIALHASPLIPAQAQTTTTTTSTTSTAGVMSELFPDAVVIRTESSTVPIRYSSSATTSFVDETGTPIARELVASGLPVTVEYLRDGERLIANRVIVHRQTKTTSAPAVVEKTTTITRPPVVVEKPVIVEKKVPVVVEKKVPVVVEKKVYVDRPVVVEKQVPAPLVEEKRTTTTTTTTSKDKKD